MNDAAPGPLLRRVVDWVATILALVGPWVAALSLTVFWSGRGLPAHKAHAWLTVWASVDEIGAVQLASVPALLITLFLAATLFMMFRAPRTSRWRAMRSAGLGLWAVAPVSVLLYIEGVQIRQTYAAGALAALPIIVGAFRAVRGKDVLPTGSSRGVARWWLRRGHHVLAVGCVLYLFAVAASRHYAHWSSLVDLGLFYELYDNPRGELLWSPTLGMNFMGEHFSPILALLWPVVRLFRSPVALLAIQSLAIGGGGLVLRYLAFERTRDALFAQLMLLAWCLNPWVQQAALYDFHMDMLESPALFGAVYAAMTRRNRWLALSCLTLFCIKEDTFLYTSFIGVYIVLAQRRYRVGVALIVVGAAQAAIVLGWLLPTLRPPFDPNHFATVATSDSYAFLSRYAHLGGSLSEILASPFTKPGHLLEHLFTGARLANLFGLFAAFGWCAALGRQRVLWLLPALEMLLGDEVIMSSFAFYYGAVVMPFGAIAATEGARFWTRRGRARRYRRAVLRASVACAVVAFAILHPSSWLAPENKYPDFRPGPRQAQIRAALDAIPKGATVSANGYHAVHLQPGRDVSMMPYRRDTADWLVVDLQRPSWPSSDEDLHFFLRRAFMSGEFELVEATDLFFVARRLPTPDAESHAVEDYERAFSDFTLEAELTELTQFRGSYGQGDDASNESFVRIAAGDSRGGGLVIWGPKLNLLPGTYVVDFRLRWSPGGRRDLPSDTVVTVDVTCERSGTLARAYLKPEQVSSAEYIEWPLEVVIDASARNCESRVHYHDLGALDVDSVRWRFTAAPADAPR